MGAWANCRQRSALQSRRVQHLAVDQLPVQRDRARVAVFGQEGEAVLVGLPPGRKIENVADPSLPFTRFRAQA